MPTYRRTGVCEDCGECCGANGMCPTSKGWEAVRNWSLDDVSESYNLWTLFGLGLNPQTETIEPESESFTYKVKGKNYSGIWHEFETGNGHVPCKNETNVECPFLMDDPGDGTRPCALKGSQDEGSRTKFCRPEENPEYVPENDIWTQRMVDQWQEDHPNCSYIFEEIIE